MRTGQEDGRASLRRRLLIAHALRAAAATVLLGAAVALGVDSAPLPGGFDAFFVLIGATYALTGGWVATSRLAEERPWVADLHSVGDIALVSGVVLATGGVGSFFTSLYALPIVAAGVVQQRRGSVSVAVLATLCYGSLVFGQYAGAVGAWGAATILPPPSDGAWRVLINAVGFIAIGLLTGWLVKARLRADHRLAAASSAMADLQAFNQRVIDNLPGGLLTTDHEGCIASANRAAEAILEQSGGTLLGQPVERVLQLGSGAFTDLAPREVRRVDVEYLKPSARRIVLGVGMTMLAADGGARGYLFTFQDVTEAKRREHEAQVQKRLAAIGQMAAGIAHEIRNPLASMAGSIQVLRRDLPLEPDQSMLMDIVLRESQRLNDTIRHFLAYARPQRPCRAHVSLARVLEETAALLRNSPERRPDHQIDVRIADATVVCEGDEAQLRQVVWNLASNGLRAMPNAGTLTLSLAAHEGRAVVSVEDTGKGMTPEQQERLFQPFHSEFAQGTGLGLAIAHRIVTEHGGTISVRSGTDVGTTVTVALTVVGSGQWTVDSKSKATPDTEPRNLDAGLEREPSSTLARTPCSTPSDGGETPPKAA